MSTLMKFQSGAVALQFEAGGDYPAKRTNKKMQVKDRTAAGTLQVENLGIYVRTRVIDFNLMSKNDYTALIQWYEDVSDGSANEFEFTDEYGDVFTARIVSDILDFDETSLNMFSGSITLELSA